MEAIMEEPSKVQDLAAGIKDYIQLRYDLIVLQGCDKASDILSDMISDFLIVAGVVITLLLLSFGAAYYISFRNGDTYSGLFIVGGVYLFLCILGLTFRRKLLKTPFRNRIIRRMFEKNVKDTKHGTL